MSDTQTEASAPKGGKGKNTEKPVMAAKKEFKLPDFQVADDVPVTLRTNSQARLPIGFDEMYAKAVETKKPIMRFIPVELWETRGITKDKQKPADNKDRLRRAFYSWQGKNEARLKYTLAFSDQADKKGDYTGTNLYVVLKPTGK